MSTQNAESTYTKMISDLLNNKQIQEKLKNIEYINSRLTKFLFVLFLVILGYMLSVMCWSLIPTKVTYKQFVANKDTSSSESNIDNFHIFGKYVHVIPQEKNKKSGKDDVDLAKIKKTKLDIKITGISASSDPKNGSAALVVKGKTDVYGVNDDIQGLRNVRVIRIYPTKVLLDNNEDLEFVILEEDDKKFQRMYADEKQTPSKQESNQELKNVRTELLGNPGSLFNMIQINPYIRDGKIVGYELKPGNDTRLFINSGLRDGDIAVEINGHDLRNDSEAMSIMGQIQNLTKIDIVVERNGDRETISLNLD